ncbi:MAG: hypothetical protein ACOC0O_06550 [Spirochaetota bacterium]
MPRHSELALRGRTALRVLTLAVVVLLGACSAPETDPDALRAPDGTPLYRDGRYAASFSHTDPEGWRAFVLVRVRAGLIQEICFDAVDAAGERLLDDERYLESYRLETGVELEPTIDRLIATMLDRQQPPLAIEPSPQAPMALDWPQGFAVLARAALEAARVGLTLDAAGIEQVPTAGPYVATDLPDELGWRGELVLVYDADGVAAASYRELRAQADGSERVKAEDESYQARYLEAHDLTSSVVSETLIGRLLGGSDEAEPPLTEDGGDGVSEEAGAAPSTAAPTGTDAVSGATVTSARFAALVARIESRRVEAPLPSRLCR